jgi:hypothetical protein
MKKKIIIGCITVVTIIIITSFNSVIGENDDSTNRAYTSPLFIFRNINTLENNHKNKINSRFLGENRIISIPIEKCDKKYDLIDIISSLDENKFINIIKQMIHNTNQKKHDVKLLDELKNDLKFVKENLENEKNPLSNFEKKYWTIYYTLCYWEPGCFFMHFIQRIFIRIQQFFVLLELFLIFILSIFITMRPTSCCPIDFIK